MPYKFVCINLSGLVIDLSTWDSAAKCIIHSGLKLFKVLDTVEESHISPLTKLYFLNFSTDVKFLVFAAYVSLSRLQMRYLFFLIGQ